MPKKHPRATTSSHVHTDDSSSCESDGPSRKVARTGKCTPTKGCKDISSTFISRKDLHMPVLIQQQFNQYSIQRPEIACDSDEIQGLRGRMSRGDWEENDLKKLYASAETVVKNLDPEDVMPHMVSKGVLDFDEVDLIRNGGRSRTRLRKAWRFLILIHQKGQEAFRCFLDALGEEKYEQVLKTVQYADVSGMCLTDFEHPFPRVASGDSHEKRHIFVETTFLEQSVKALTTNGRLLLCGPPGSGKTTIAKAVLDRFSEEGFPTHHCTQVVELKEIIRTSVGIVLLDGVLGDASLDQVSYKHLKSLLPRLSQCVGENKKLFIIFTVLPHVLKELRSREERPLRWLLQPSVLIDMSSALTELERNKILKCHLQYKDVSLPEESIAEILQKDQTGATFPLHCRQLVENWTDQKDPSVFFSQRAAAEAYVPLLKQMLGERDKGELIAAVFSLIMLGEKGFLHNIKQIRGRLKNLGFSEKVAPYLIQEALGVLKGSLINEDGDSFFSETIRIAVGFVFGCTFRQPLLLKFCNTDFIVQYITTDPSDDFPICIEKENISLFFHTIVNHAEEGAVLEICQHPSLTKQSFLHEFEVYCSTSHERLIYRWVHASDAQHQMPMLYWAVFSNPSFLLQAMRWTEENSRMNITDVLIKMAFVLVLTIKSYASDREKLATVLGRLKASCNTYCHSQDRMAVSVPLPRKASVITNRLREKCDLLLSTLSQEFSLCGKNDFCLPRALAHFRLSGSEIIVSLKKCLSYVILRLLSVKHIDEQDEQGDTVLHDAVRTGDEDAIKFILQEGGASLLVHNKQGLAPPQIAAPNQPATEAFFSACDRGRVHEAKLLACMGADFGRRDEAENSALHIACGHGESGVVRLLIGLGLNVNALNSSCKTPFVLAFEEAHVATMSVLLEHGASVNQHGQIYNPLFIAVKNSDLKIVKLLLENNGDVNFQDGNGASLLHAAVKAGCPEMVGLLIERGAETNRLTPRGNSPLHIAVREGELQITQMLVSARSDVNCRNNVYETPLHLAASRGHLSLAKYLLENGAEASAKTKFGCTPLALAKKRRNCERMKKLLKAHGGVDIRALSVEECWRNQKSSN